MPRWLCNADGRICLAAALALFDEVSTFAGVVPWDRQWRPGATVQLSAQAYRPLDVGAGQELVFKTRKVKMGKTLAYVDGNIMGAEGHILAFARHIKFQPMVCLYGFTHQSSLCQHVNQCTRAHPCECAHLQTQSFFPKCIVHGTWREVGTSIRLLRLISLKTPSCRICILQIRARCLRSRHCRA